MGELFNKGGGGFGTGGECGDPPPPGKNNKGGGGLSKGGGGACLKKGGGVVLGRGGGLVYKKGGGFVYKKRGGACLQEGGGGALFLEGEGLFTRRGGGFKRKAKGTIWTTPALETTRRGGGGLPGRSAEAVSLSRVAEPQKPKGCVCEMPRQGPGANLKARKVTKQLRPGARKGLQGNRGDTTKAENDNARSSSACNVSSEGKKGKSNHSRPSSYFAAVIAVRAVPQQQQLQQSTVQRLLRHEHGSLDHPCWGKLSVPGFFVWPAPCEPGARN